MREGVFYPAFPATPAKRVSKMWTPGSKSIGVSQCVRHRTEELFTVVEDLFYNLRAFSSRAELPRAYASLHSLSSILRVRRAASNSQLSGLQNVRWHGVHSWLRYQSQFDLYYVSINRADNLVVTEAANRSRSLLLPQTACAKLARLLLEWCEEYGEHKALCKLRRILHRKRLLK
jgi:hypothetical protein